MAKDKEDLGIKIGTPKEAKWNEILLAQKENLIANEINAEIAKTLITLAEMRIEKEKEKFK